MWEEWQTERGVRIGHLTLVHTVNSEWYIHHHLSPEHTPGGE